jgi:epoxide hydrolase 4
MLNYYRASDAGPPDPGRGRSKGGFVSGFAPKELTVQVPTLVMCAEASLLPLNLIDGLDTYVPDLSVVTVPGAGHWLPEERPDEVNASIRRFLSG